MFSNDKGESKFKKSFFIDLVCRHGKFERRAFERVMDERRALLLMEFLGENDVIVFRLM